jgi:hypothetical protein
MRVRTPLFALTLSLASVAALSGCTATPPAPVVTDPAAVVAPEASPSLAPNPPEADSILWVRAVATASNGAELSLEAMLHRAVSYEYPGSQTMNQIIIDDCGATLTNAIIYADTWSINRMNVTAIPPEGSAEWPTDARVDFRPTGDAVYAASRGVIQADPSTGDLACTQDKYLAGAGRGAIAVGLPGDTIDLDTFSNGWTRHTWGFTAPAGVTLSECTFEVTDLGREYGGGPADWVEVADASSCYVGPASEGVVS